MRSFLKLFQKAKELNITSRNLMCTDNLLKFIINTILRYKGIIFGADSPICIECLNKIRKQQVIDEISRLNLSFV